jgi:integrase
MRLRREQARALLSRVDPARRWRDRRVGLRDGALLALVAAGLSAPEIAGLKASDIAMTGGRVIITVDDHDGGTQTFFPAAPLAARILAWLRERRLWGTDKPVFTGRRGTSISIRGTSAVFERYRHPRRTRR